MKRGSSKNPKQNYVNYNQKLTLEKKNNKPTNVKELFIG